MGRGIMQKVTYLKEPGYIQDLYFVFVLHFVGSNIPDALVLKKQEAEDLQFFKEALERFGTFDEDLLPFFYFKDNTFCFMSVKYWRDYNFLDDFGFDSVLADLFDKKAVYCNMMNFFLGVTEEYERYGAVEIGGLIRDLSYPDSVKCRLALFFMNPDYYIEKLIAGLKEKEAILRQYYNESSDHVYKIQARIDTDALISKIGQSAINMSLPSSKIYYSIALIEKNRISCKNNDNGLFFFLGFAFQEKLDEYLDSNTPPDITLWGKICSEKNRIAILELIKENGELCTSEIADRINLSSTAVYYHMEMMLDARMLNSRNEGRTIFYSINQDYFRRVCEELRKFTKE